MLVDTWLPLRAEREPDILWTDIYPDLADEMQRAQLARIVWSERPNFFSRQIENPKLITMQKLRGQRSYGQAGRTVAYVLWGDFLAANHSSVDFCKACLHPFPYRPNKEFYPSSCGTNTSSLKAHKLKVRRENWDLLIKAARKLRKRIDSRKPRKLLDGLATGRWLTRFIRAAENPSDQAARARLLDLCCDGTWSHKAEVQSTLYQFLDDIAIARSCVAAKQKRT
jgi:hypothetical protein